MKTKARDHQPPMDKVGLISDFPHRLIIMWWDFSSSQNCFDLEKLFCSPVHWPNRQSTKKWTALCCYVYVKNSCRCSIIFILRFPWNLEISPRELRDSSLIGREIHFKMKTFSGTIKKKLFLSPQQNFSTSFKMGFFLFFLSIY